MAAFPRQQELNALAQRARQLAAIGQLQAAREHWLAAFQLLPSDSPQRGAVLREIQKIDAKLSPRPTPRTDWKTRLGPVGVALAAVLAKGKFFLGIFAFVGVYWSLFSWPFAVGLFGSVLLHEMGHYLLVRRFGFSAELPMFIPGFGAYVKWNGGNVDPGVRAQISLAGPLFGFLSGLIAYGIFLQTGHGVWLAVAQVAGWLNLLNLIPVFIFDGASAMNALGRQERLMVLVVSAVLWFLFRDEWLFLGVAAGTAYRLFWRRDFPVQSRPGIGYYFIVLVVANGLLSWYCLNQAHSFIARPAY